MTRTIMLIHGAWLTPASWDRFRNRYEAAGFTVLVPAWPGLDRPVAALQSTADPQLRKLGISQITDHYAAIIRDLPEPPIVIGHSFGGLIVQLLLDRGLGAAGVAIDPTPPFGVPAHPIAIWTSLSIFLAWNGWNRVMTMRFSDFATGFANTLPVADLPGEYAAQVVPTPGRIFFQAVLGIGARVTWKSAIRAPLLLIAAQYDRTVPEPMVEKTYRKQTQAASLTAFKMFPARSHFLCNEPGWEAVADHALDWATTHAPAA